MNYFIFKGIDSRTIPGLIVNELPSIVKAAPKVEKYDVPGRNGSLTVSTGGYSNTLQSISCSLMDSNSINSILMWLDGSGELVLSNQPNKLYKASISNQISLDRVLYNFRNFIIEFECLPQAFILNENTIELTAPGSFMGEGNKPSSPILHVTGSGDASIVINGKVIELKGIDEYITIDCDLLQCHKDKINMGKKMIGYFPTLSPEINDVSWTGNITKISIKPNWFIC